CVSSGAIFFFQAEDGIRDFHVTGVQTCALPIFLNFMGLCSDASVANFASLPLFAIGAFCLKMKLKVAQHRNSTVATLDVPFLFIGVRTLLDGFSLTVFT